MIARHARKILLISGAVALLFLISALYIFAQYGEYKRIGVNCGGDFSYVIKCPRGTACKITDRNLPQAGGTCAPEKPISSFLDFLAKA